MKPVGIQSFALSCALGTTKQAIFEQAKIGAVDGMLLDDQYLFEGQTYLGKVPPSQHPIKPFFNCRINQMLLGILSQLDASTYQPTLSRSPSKVGVILGTSTSAVDELESALPEYDRTGQWPAAYQYHQQRMGHVAEFLADHLGVKGPVMSVSTACSSGAKALLSARRWLQQGVCDVVIAGGIDVLCQMTVNGFNALGALSAERSIPFSEHRNGINIGEGGALFVLTRSLADINLLGGGESSDAHHISAPDPEGKGAIGAMSLALKDAGLAASDIDYINLHGTGTPQNDVMEAKAVNQVFGDAVWCSSTKAITGHTLGAAGAVEAGLCALSMSSSNHQGFYLPHVYDGHYDPKLQPLKLVTEQVNAGGPRTILSNSFAFGGSNAALVLGARHE